MVCSVCFILPVRSSSIEGGLVEGVWDLEGMGIPLRYRGVMEEILWAMVLNSKPLMMKLGTISLAYFLTYGYVCFNGKCFSFSKMFNWIGFVVLFSDPLYFCSLLGTNDIQLVIFGVLGRVRLYDFVAGSEGMFMRCVSFEHYPND